MIKIPIDTDADVAGKKIEDFAKKSRTALNSLSLVAQDLPFGFIGIQNNLPGVISSFGELTMEAGSVAGALKQLGSALIGPAGLFLAFSAVTAGVTYAIQQYGSLGKAIDVLIFSGRALSKEQQEIAKNVANEGTQVLTLYGLYKNLGDSREKQVEIVKKLNQISPEYFGNLDSEKTKIDELKGSIDRYIDSFIGKIYVETQQKKITELITKYAEKISFVIDKEIELDKQREKSANNITNFIRDSELLAKAQGKASDISINAPKIEIKKTTQEVIDNLRNQLKLSVEEVFKGVGKFKQFIDIGEIFGTKGQDKTPKAIKEAAKKTKKEIFKYNKELEVPKVISGEAKIVKNQKFLDTQAIAAEFALAKEVIDGVFFNPIAESFENFINTGKFTFDEFAKNIKANIAKIVAQIAASKIVELLGTIFAGPIAGGLSQGGGFLSMIGNILPAFRANTRFEGVRPLATGGGQKIDLVLRGTDLVGSINRTNAQISRVG